MNSFNRLLSRNELKSKDVARRRLQHVLVHDRVNLSPGKMDQIKADLLQVLSRYVEVDRDGIRLVLTHSNRQSRLTAQVPVIGAPYK